MNLDMYLYPKNSAVRNAIPLYLQNRFNFGEGIVPKSMVLVSGGLDSVALLSAVLNYTKHEVHAHFVELHNPENRAAAEKIAVHKCIDYLSRHCRPFAFSTSRLEQMVGEKDFIGPDASVAMFMAAQANLARGAVFDAIWTGHMHGPVYEYDGAAAILNACHASQRSCPYWLVPFLNFRKFDLYASIPPELAELTWTCRSPIYDSSGQPHKCGNCHGCESRARLKILEDFYRNPPQQPMAKTADDEQYPCLYPKYDNYRNVLRCSVCANCNVILQREQKVRMQPDKEIADRLKEQSQ